MSKFAVKSTALLLALGFAGTAMSAESLQDVMKRRNLNQQDLLAAAKTYVPTGKRDEFLAFSSGGQSGQVLVYGIPSMRILKYIGVFTPEPWQGYGFDEESKAVLRQGNIDGKEINWGVSRRGASTNTQCCLPNGSHRSADTGRTGLVDMGEGRQSIRVHRAGRSVGSNRSPSGRGCEGVK